MQKSRLLMTEQPIVINKELATITGLNEAIILQQIEYWININQKARKERSLQDGYWWTYNTVEEWNKEFPFWSYDTVKRSLKKLRDKGILITSRFNIAGYDRTLWYRINYKKLDEIAETFNSAKCPNEEKSNFKDINIIEPAKNLNSAKCPNAKVQNALMQKCKMPQPIPETTENNKEIKSSSSTEQIETLNNLYEEAFNKKITNHMKNKINDYIEKTNIDFIIEVLKYCIDHDAKTPSYFFKTLDNLISKNIVTVKDLELSITKHNNSIETKKKSKRVIKNVEDKKKLKTNNFENRNYNFDELESQLLGYKEYDPEVLEVKK